MKNKSRIIIFISVLAIFIGYISWEFYKLDRVDVNVELTNKVLAVVKSSDYIDFSKVTDFEWDTMYIFKPYSDATNILKDNDVRNYNTLFNIEHNDSINMIAFVNKNKLITFIETSRSGFEVNSMINHKIDKDKANFKVINNGEIILKFLNY